MSICSSDLRLAVELTEDRNAAYFQRAHMFIPIIHPSRYFQAFYSAPHKRPPMCLQYAVWTMASNGHDKYGHYHDIFYKRARQYADGDEMRVSFVLNMHRRRVSGLHRHRDMVNTSSR